MKDNKREILTLILLSVKVVRFIIVSKEFMKLSQLFDKVELSANFFSKNIIRLFRGIIL